MLTYRRFTTALLLAAALCLTGCAGQESAVPTTADTTMEATTETATTQSTESAEASSTEDTAADTSSSEDSSGDTTASSASADATAPGSEVQENTFSEKEMDALTETGEDYVQMSLDALDTWAGDAGLTKNAAANVIVWSSEKYSLVLTLDEEGNGVSLVGTASGTAKEQYDFYRSYYLFVLTGEIYGRCDSIASQLLSASDLQTLSVSSAGEAEDSVVITLTGNPEGTTLTISRPSGGPFIEFG
jgi:hypothetical protein